MGDKEHRIRMNTRYVLDRGPIFLTEDVAV